jgi:hypothetical protein
MAALIEMTCPDCNFVSEKIYFGATGTDDRCLGPALDVESQKIVEVDLQEAHMENIVPYTDSKLHNQSPAEKRVKLQASEHTIPLHNNFCPSCNGFTLKVETVLMLN